MEGLIFLLALWGIVGLLNFISWISDLHSNSKKYWENKLEIENLESNKMSFEKERQEFQQLIKQEREDISKIIKQKSIQFPWLAAAISDYYEMIDARKEYYLRHKSHPAQSAADVVKEVRKEKKVLQRTNRLLSYKIEYYENLFPWLTELIDDEEDANLEDAEYIEEVDSNEDKVKGLLTKEEYKKLPSVERNQLALDRYLNSRKKSNWQVGRDYEMYVGYICEQKWYQVEYKWIIDWYEDMGRDIIAKKDWEIKIIQCKYWSQKKEIHEKHIFQLFWTTMEYWIRNMATTRRNKTFDEFADFLKENKLKPLFFTSTKLSDKARKIAETLNIQVIENHPIGNFPRIKCNISSNWEKIYHLPFDQQYDRTIIEKNKWESHKFTVQDAEDAWFRRAFRHNF